MPLYEYACEDCGERSEVLQQLNDTPLSVCPSCSGKLRKLFSAPTFQFKGSGWYATDYSGKKGGGDPGAAKEGADPSSARVVPSGGAEPAAKSEKSEAAAPAPSPAKPPDSKPAS
jgi:putative FmdB family regulatory protein